jgi:hypothetical protein
LIFNEFAPATFNTFSTVMQRPKTSGLNASSPSFDITTTIFALFAPDLIIPFALFELDLPIDFIFAPSATLSAVKTALFPLPFSPVM